MSSHPLPTQPDDREQDALYYRRILHDVIDMAVDLARIAHRDAMAPTPDPTLAFDRIARTIRRTVALARSLHEPPPAAAKTPHREIARRRILREVEDAIQRHESGARAASLHAEALERMDGPDLDDDIAHTPIGQIITDICRDLGLHAPGTPHPWKRRTPTDIATLNAQAARPPLPERSGPAQPEAATPWRPTNPRPKPHEPPRPPRPTLHQIHRP